MPRALKTAAGGVDKGLPEDRKGKAKAKSMALEERKELARTGAAARWG
jgi:hypothetical protein